MGLLLESSIGVVVGFVGGSLTRVARGKGAGH